jgi:uncharacterized protein
LVGESIRDVSLHVSQSGRIQSGRGGCLRSARLAIAVLAYSAIVIALGVGFHRSAHLAAFGFSFPRTFASFSLLLAPLWFLGFVSADRLHVFSTTTKVFGASLLGLPYFVFSSGTPEFDWRVAVVVVAFPLLLAAFLGTPELPPEMSWRDAAVLAMIAASYFLHWFQRAWPSPALAVLPKLFLADVALYCFLIVRKIDGAGYCLVSRRSALVTGIREWTFYFPLALSIGELSGFIHFHAVLPGVGKTVADVLLTFLLIALPEELFFRSILQNLLETRLGKNAALGLAAVLFGLSHFHHGASFNWRYVLLASVAGIFYGRAWRRNRQIFAAIVTHTGVDVVWSLWFR